MYENFYKEKLYPFQDSVLKLIDDLDTHFYLTGGTALSRCYLNHRYSDDLDFFVNDLVEFKTEVYKVQKELDSKYDVEVERAGEKFQRLIIRKDEVISKLEFINDFPFHFGGFESSKVFTRIDNIFNILSNKITAAVDRNEVKDFADIFSIVRYLEKIDWKAIFVSASSKSAGIFVPLVAERLGNFNFDMLKQIKWISSYEHASLKSVQEEIVKTMIGL